MLVEGGDARLHHFDEAVQARPVKRLRVEIPLELPHGGQPFEQAHILQQPAQQHVRGDVGVAVAKPGMTRQSAASITFAAPAVSIDTGRADRCDRLALDGHRAALDRRCAAHRHHRAVDDGDVRLMSWPFLKTCPAGRSADIAKIRSPERFRRSARRALAAPCKGRHNDERHGAEIGQHATAGRRSANCAPGRQSRQR